jgi:hypothetical protein
LVGIFVDVSMDTSPDSIRVVGEGDLLELGRVARSTWKNWARQGLVDDPEDGLYGERDIIEAVVVRLVVEAVGLRAARAAWRPAREAVLARLQSAEATDIDEVRTVIDLHTWQLLITTDASALLEELRRTTPFPRGRVVLTVGPAVAEARTAFWARAAFARDLRRDRRRRTSVRARENRARG